jgi:catechol 2,3-dioxygenase-like lactoylglutathione lyase family enzyme
MNLNQITVPVLDVEKAIEFYEKLGLRLIVRSLPRYARFECPSGDATFSLHQTARLPGGDGISVYFECENLDAQVANLQGKGIGFLEMPNDKPWLWREAHLRDPDGNHIILFHAGDYRKNPPWRIH